MPIHPTAFSPLIVLLVVSVVYWDASRRGLTRQARLRWAGGAGLVSFGGFYTSLYAFDEFFIRVYAAFFGIDSSKALTAADLLTRLFEIGVAISALTVLVYMIGSRWGPLESRAS